MTIVLGAEILQSRDDDCGECKWDKEWNWKSYGGSDAMIRVEKIRRDILRGGWARVESGIGV